jgi:hypothetical protein
LQTNREKREIFFFFSFFPFVRQIVSTTCVHVAGKVEETPKRITGTPIKSHSMLRLNFDKFHSDIVPAAYAMWYGESKPLDRKSSVRRNRIRLHSSIQFFSPIALQIYAY